MWAPECGHEPCAVPVSVPSAPTSTLTPPCLWARWWLGGASPQEAESCPLAAEGLGGPAGRDHPLCPVRPSAAGGDILTRIPLFRRSPSCYTGAASSGPGRGREEPQARGQPGGDGVRRSRRFCPPARARGFMCGRSRRPCGLCWWLLGGLGGAGESAVGGQACARPAAVAGPGPAGLSPREAR